MRIVLCALVLVIFSTPASAVNFSWFYLVNENFNPLGEDFEVHIVLVASSTIGPDTPVVMSDALPLGLEMVPGSLVCYMPPGSGDCSHDAPTRTVSWTGDLSAYDGVDVIFSATTTGLAGPGYVTNVVTATASTDPPEQAEHTTVFFTEDEWPILSEVIPLAVSDPSYSMRYATGVAWNPVSEKFLAAWNRGDQSSGQEVVVVRTVNPSGTLGEIRQVSEVNVAGEEPVWAKIACSTAAATCLVAWEENQPPDWYRGVHARLINGDGVSVGSEFIVARNSGVNRGGVDVVYNPVRDEYLVVYVNQWDGGVVDVAATRVRASDGVLLGSAVVATGTDGDRDGIRPAHLAGRDQYLLVYDFEDLAENEEVRAKLAPGDLVGVGAAPELILASGLGDHRAPVVAAEGDEYLVAWTYYDDNWPNLTTEIRARRFAGDGTPLGPAGGFLVDEFAAAGGIQTRQVQFAGEQGFLIGWYYRDPNGSDGDLHGRFVEVGTDQAAFLEFPTVSTDSLDQPGYFACADSGQCMVLTEDNEGVDVYFTTAWRALVDGFEDGGYGGWSVVVGDIP